MTVPEGQVSRICHQVATDGSGAEQGQSVGDAQKLQAGAGAKFNVHS